ncbi:EAL domain-containing protein [Vibrio splendidus]|uniref:EAL domain-containing protein n=1 Tax=Vibrio splendidus TaxID=29497 RepID=UPI0024699D72|nr:EAL domain-containing protein [Vibrio splendidus]MDH5911488.1 EAL domain-containing protein [Vibrio splendidus]MDH5942727.1 EAL domain-containing protein [Vibrio splendidus]MDH5985726.1 EAL domain-containing protein [Vibrio splendidus]MDH5994304.1 EAL domain-containing protein [Vibrio splendidus]MDH6005153.1 EAL domain-containing protein [Vibrio splendidus]
MTSDNLYTKQNQTGTSAFKPAHFSSNMIQGKQPQPIQTDVRFIVQYKPKFCIRTKRVVGVEPQVWLKSVIDNSTRPCDPSLHYTDQVVERMTMFSLKQSLHDCSLWGKMGQELDLVVNVSAKQICEAAFPQVVSNLLEHYRIPSKRLTLNVLPCRSRYEEDKLVASLAILNLLGIKLSLGQFGGESASVTLLGIAKFTEVKIDSSIIDKISYSHKSKEILLTLISLAKRLNLKVVADGIKYSYQNDLLLEYGIDYIQGENFSKQLTAHEISDLFTKLKMAS